MSIRFPGASLAADESDRADIPVPSDVVVAREFDAAADAKGASPCFDVVVVVIFAIIVRLRRRTGEEEEEEEEIEEGKVSSRTSTRISRQRENDPGETHEG